MEKILFYGMIKEKMCFQHVLMNAIDLYEDKNEVKIIFEGASVTLVPVFEAEENPLYLKAKSLGLIAGVCLACSKMLGVYDDVVKSELPLLSDMNAHAGMKSYIKEGYKVVSI